MGDFSLENKNKDEGNFAQLDYLLRYSIVSYAYSATLWVEMQNPKARKTPSKGLLALAPSYEGKNKTEERNNDWKILRENLSQLQGAEAEVKALQKRFKGSFLFGEQAGEKQFRELSAHYSILHLAMHGVVNSHNTAYSDLFFTDSSDSLHDDILFAYEIPSLTLSAELVVLSACETGFGKYQNGEGVMSLGRGFMYAGVPALVMTLWEVNDLSAERLMGSFYAYLAEGWPKDKALQQAKLDFIDKSDAIAAHPYFWSNFILLGNANPIEFLPQKSSLLPWVLGTGLLLLLLLGLWWKSKQK